MKACCPPQEHPDHSAQMSRLNRIGGQVNGVKKMIEERRYCPEILTQLRAIRAAVQSVEANILETHLGACVGDAFRSGDDKAREDKIKEIVKLFRQFETDK